MKLPLELWEDDQPWRQEAYCLGMDPYESPFFVTQGGSTGRAKAICFGGAYRDEEYPGCEVRLECLRYSVQKEERFGLWGGRSQTERKLLVAIMHGEDTGEPTDEDLQEIESEEDPGSESPGLLVESDSS